MSGVIAQVPIFQFSKDGEPLVNGTLETYISGSNTPTPTFQDAALTSANTNPIVLNGRGECVLFLDSTKKYRFKLFDSLGGLQWTQDNIVGSPGALSISGIVSGGISSYTVSTALTDADLGKSIYYNGSNNGVITLPDIALTSAGNSVITIYNQSQKLLSVTRQGTTALINAKGISAPSIQLLPGEGLQLLSDGTNWLQLGVNGASGVVDLTGYTGADIALLPGQLAVYDVVAAGNILLRIASGDNQMYTATGAFSNLAGAAGASTLLLPNNTTFTTALTVSVFNVVGGTVAGSATTQNAVLLDPGKRVFDLDFKISTKTIAKTVKSQFMCLDNGGVFYSGLYSTAWNDTVTAWTSLGTLQFANAVTGRITVRREY